MDRRLNGYNPTQHCIDRPRRFAFFSNPGVACHLQKPALVSPSDLSATDADILQRIAAGTMARQAIPAAELALIRAAAAC